MKKIVEIESCYDCPHRLFNGNQIICGNPSAKSKNVGNGLKIPNSCPLKDASSEQG